jgi:hypothetical protein
MARLLVLEEAVEGFESIRHQAVDGRKEVARGMDFA